MLSEQAGDQHGMIEKFIDVYHNMACLATGLDTLAAFWFARPGSTLHQWGVKE